MDPLSVAASVVGLIHAAEAAGSALHRLWSLRHAPAHLENLQNEVRSPIPGFRMRFTLTAASATR